MGSWTLCVCTKSLRLEIPKTSCWFTDPCYGGVLSFIISKSGNLASLLVHLNVFCVSHVVIPEMKSGPIALCESVWLTPVNFSYSEIQRGTARRGLGEAEKGESDQVWMDRRGLRKYWFLHSEDNDSLISQMRCLLNIWGVMLFLRLTWVIGQCGIGKCHQELLCLTIGHLVEWRASAPKAWFSCQ